MRKKKIRILIAAVIIAAVGSTVTGLTKLRGNYQKEIQYLSASWTYNYSGIKEISRASDVIALIKVNKPVKSFETQGIPLTEYSANVITPVLGTESNKNLTIVMTGKETDDKIVEVEGDPLPESGEEFLVFCKKNQDGTLKILSGPQGRLSYSGGKLNSLNVADSKERNANDCTNITVANADAGELINEIKSYVKAE